MNTMKEAIEAATNRAVVESRKAHRIVSIEFCTDALEVFWPANASRGHSTKDATKVRIEAAKRIAADLNAR